MATKSFMDGLLYALERFLCFFGNIFLALTNQDCVFLIKIAISFASLVDMFKDLISETALVNVLKGVGFNKKCVFSYPATNSSANAVTAAWVHSNVSCCVVII